MFFLKVIVLQLLIQNLKSDCGRPGFTKIFTLPLSFYSGDYIFLEETQVKYDDCAFGSMLFYDPIRTCKKGKWTGRVPKCGNL
jgi:hypothetical protein